MLPLEKTTPKSQKPTLCHLMWWIGQGRNGSLFHSLSLNMLSGTNVLFRNSFFLSGVPPLTAVPVLAGQTLAEGLAVFSMWLNVTQFQFNSACAGQGGWCPLLTLILVFLLQLQCAQQEYGAAGTALTSQCCSFGFVGNNELPWEIAVSFKAIFSTKVPLNLMKT